MSKIILQAENICKSFKSEDAGTIKVLSNVNLKVQEAEWIMLIGSSGSGKSTLLNLLGALDTPNQGSISLNGKAYSHLRASGKAAIRQKNIGFVFQNFQLIPELTALENVMLPGLFAKSNSQVKKRALDLLEEVGLKDRASHHPGALSGGEQQRVAICRALINDPELILADEPTGNLDSKTSEQVIAIFTRLQKDLNKSIVMVTHNNDLQQHATRVYNLDKGKIS
jgi:putative ABC transport system ATP-binding protein